MQRFTIPIVARTLVVVDAEDLASAIDEAQRVVQLGGPGDGFLEGWNDVQKDNDAPLIESVGEFAIVSVEEDAIRIGDVPKDDEDDQIEG